MNILKGFESLIQRQSEIDKEVKELRKDEKVQKYLELQTERENIRSVQSDLYTAFKEDQFDKCNHMWVTVLSDKDREEGCTYDYHGCVKCGLNKSVYYLVNLYGTTDMLSDDQKIMYEYLQTHDTVGRLVKAKCDLTTATLFYRKLKRIHPNASDEVIAEYLKRLIRDANELNKDNGYAKIKVNTSA
jgi:hypothetical protein